MVRSRRGLPSCTRPNLAGLGIELLLLSPPDLLLQRRREVFRELPEGLPLCQSFLDCFTEDVELDGLGDGEGVGVFLAPDVPIVEPGAQVLGAEIVQGFPGDGEGKGFNPLLSGASIHTAY